MDAPHSWPQRYDPGQGKSSFLKKRSKKLLSLRLHDLAEASTAAND
jgi:hypothetical protein